MINSGFCCLGGFMFKLKEKTQKEVETKNGEEVEVVTSSKE